MSLPLIAAAVVLVLIVWQTLNTSEGRRGAPTVVYPLPGWARAVGVVALLILAADAHVW